MKIIVIGALVTDIFAKGVSHFPQPGEYVHGEKVIISAGGRPRNIAEMAACLMPENTVSMIGKTVRDTYSLWKPPVEALKTAGVNVDYVGILSTSDSYSMPDLSLISLDQKGRSQMYTIFGGAVLHKEDLDSARPLFEQASREDGMLIITVSCPIEIIHYAMELADHYGIKVLCDPGGITPEMGRTAFLDRRIFLIKPNEYEAELLTGVAVVNSKTAEQAARILQGQGCENVLITVGAEGAYLFTKDGSTRHILVPLITDEGQKNEVGCGDQVMATLCALLGEGYDLEEAANQAVTAGTLQFHKETVSPVTRDELMAVNS